MGWMCEAFQQLPTNSWSKLHNQIVTGPSTALQIHFFNEDWVPFVDNLEEIVRKALGDEEVKFLFYICKHGVKSEIDNMVEELTRRLNLNFSDKILFWQMHIAWELTPQPSAAVFVDLNKIKKLGGFINESTRCDYEHIDGGYGYFSNMRNIHSCKNITYFTIYNPLYHQRRLDDSCTLTAASLLGNATAFGKKDKLRDTLRDRCNVFINNIDGYIMNVRDCILARAEAVMTCDKIEEISVHNINLKLEEILQLLLVKKILVIINGDLLKKYLRTLSDLFNTAAMYYHEMEKPATKERLSQLYYAENTLIWYLERSFNWCNRLRLAFNENSQGIIQNLQAEDLKSTFCYPNMREQLLRNYRNLPTSSWSEFPRAINSDGSFNKEYIVLLLYTAYSIETGGLRKIGVQHGRMRYCPLICLKSSYIAKNRFDAHFGLKVAAIDVAQCIIYPDTVVGAMTTSLVYTEDELDKTKSGPITLRRMYRYLTDNHINVFPTKLIEGSKSKADQRSWSPLIVPNELFQLSVPSSSRKETNTIQEVHPSVRRQMNLKQYRKPKYNPFQTLNQQRHKNSVESEQNENGDKTQASNVNVNKSVEMSEDEDDEECRHDEELNSSSSIDFAGEISSNCSGNIYVEEPNDCEHNDESILLEYNASVDLSADAELDCEHGEELNSSSSFDFAAEIEAKCSRK